MPALDVIVVSVLGLSLVMTISTMVARDLEGKKELSDESAPIYLLLLISLAVCVILMVELFG